MLCFKSARFRVMAAWHEAAALFGQWMPE